MTVDAIPHQALAAAEEARAKAEEAASVAQERLAAQGGGEAAARAARQVEAEVARTRQAEEALAEERAARAALEAQLARLQAGPPGGAGDAAAAQREADELRER